MAYNFTRYVDHMAKNGLDTGVASNYALKQILRCASKELPGR